MAKPDDLGRVGDINELLSHCEYESCDKDENGQLIYKSRIYEWKDGTFHREPDPAYKS